MKKEKENETRAKSPDRLILKLPAGNPVQTGQGIQSQQYETRSPFLRRVYPSCRAGMPEAFILQQGRGAGFTIGKGPPGLSPDSGEDTGWNPDNKAGPPTGNVQTMNSLKSYNTIHQINKERNSNFLQTLIFKIMKKQILILVLFVLATFAGVNNSYGQCTPAPLTPAAGVEYTYSVSNAGTGAKYDWYVTKDVNVLTNIVVAAATPMFTVNASTPYHDAATGVNNIKLTWTAASVADGGPFYLVIRYTETTSGTAGCTVENMKVEEIKPINTFLLAFEGGTFVTPNYVATASSNTCAANITGALVTVATPSTVLLTYGQNTLYYVATASGIIGDWYPQIQLPALQTSQVYVSAGWSADMTGGGAFTSFAPALTGATQDLLSTAPATASVAGTPILIKIVIDNVNWQTLDDQPVLLKLDGFLPPTPIALATSKSDIDAATCLPLAAFGRSATYTINKRPTVAPTPAPLGLTNP